MEGVESHNSPGCVPKLCADGCSVFERCEKVPFCVVERTEPLRGGGTTRVTVARGPCDASATCEGEMGATPGLLPCTPLEVCVGGSSNPNDPQAAPSSRCGCHVVGQPGSRAGAWLALLGFASVVARRRRDPPHRGAYELSP
jgi:MYXO-CTERM domain-containing protein